MNPNPIIKLDYPDPDVIRVGDTYYMVSTTMHFMPGCEILRSYDLIHWEHATYVYETLDSTEGQCMEGEKNIYGQGMWAASIRYHKDTYYVCFVANDTHKTYLYTTKDIEQKWEKHCIEGFYHDCSLFFDDDDKVYIVYGNKEIWITQLNEDLSEPLVGGLHRLIVNDEGHTGLGYEGTHMYKINGKYYVFFIHSRRDMWKRVQACFFASSLEEEFIGGDVLEDDRGYCNQGVAQGGIVDTKEGEWFGVLFQDHGAVGRIPVLVPVTWENDYPVFGIKGKIPKTIITKSTRPDYSYSPLVGSDDFKAYTTKKDGSIMKKQWQFNHEPDKDNIVFNKEEGYYQITTAKLCNNLTQARNTLTQRMLFPSCMAEVTIDVDGIKEGDYAGLCALQGCYGMVAVTKREGKYYVVMKNREATDDSLRAMEHDDSKGREWEAIVVDQSKVRVKVEVNFENMVDEAIFSYYNGAEFVQIGVKHKLYFKMDHFSGCRFGLFAYATKQIGGNARFSNFIYN